MGASVSVAQGAPLDAGTYKADEAAVERFCELLRIPTVSRENIAERDDEPFSQWIPTLQRLYPHFFKIAELTRVDDFGMLLRWPGADSALDPIVMMRIRTSCPSRAKTGSTILWSRDLRRRDLGPRITRHQVHRLGFLRGRRAFDCPGLRSPARCLVLLERWRGNRRTYCNPCSAVASRA